MALVHASCVEWEGIAVLLRGPSASGKSDLALRLIDGGARLVADDQVDLSAVRGELIASAPEALAGMIEVRGLGVVHLPEERVTPRARVALAVDLGPGLVVPRLPEPAHTMYDGIRLPVLVLAAFEASTPSKIRLALTGVEHVAEASGRSKVGGR
ncbi:MAG: aldolase [Alphaproteobacteria bacterium]|nr:aldolase [Alphaproteobacteria bacterium]